MADIEIRGDEVNDELDVHRTLARQLEFGEHYGWNLAALRDRLLADIPRPVRIVWTHSEESRRALGEERFDAIIRIFAEASDQDRAFGWTDRFEYVLR